MKMPLLIGLPGSGKTTLSSYLGKILELDVVSTDKVFRIVRGIPIGACTEPGHEVVARFLQKAKIKFPESYTALKQATKKDPADPKERSFLSDGDTFRAFGEEVFRAFESTMNRWLLEKGSFANRIVDISGSAPLYQENRDVFGGLFTIVLVTLDRRTLGERLLKDYLDQETAAKAGRKLVLRGRYESLVKEALKLRPLTNKNREPYILEELLRVSDRDRKEREDCFRAWADIELEISEELSPEQAAYSILSTLGIG